MKVGMHSWPCSSGTQVVSVTTFTSMQRSVIPWPALVHAPSAWVSLLQDIAERSLCSGLCKDGKLNFDLAGGRAADGWQDNLHPG